MVWPCRWPECERWAQSNGLILCSGHFRESSIFLEHYNSGAEVLVNLRNNPNGATAENDQTVEGPPFFPGDRRQRRQPRPLPVAREEVGGGASGGSSIFPEGQNPAPSATTSSGSKRGGGGGARTRVR
jgi:hypothetical protein